MPIGKGQGPRIQKPRTAAQRAQTKRVPSLVCIPEDQGMPTESWWTRPRSREEFDQVAAHERERMRDSKFGLYRMNLGSSL